MKFESPPGNRIRPAKPEPEYAKITRYADKHGGINLLVCARCGVYVWDLQAHEDWHR